MLDMKGLKELLLCHFILYDAYVLKPSVPRCTKIESCASNRVLCFQLEQLIANSSPENISCSKMGVVKRA